MAQNTAENTKFSSAKAENLETTCAVDKTVFCDEKAEVTDADKTESTLKETADATEKDKVVKRTDTFVSKKQSNVCKNDYNGDSPKEEDNFGKETSEKTSAIETKENNLEESCLASEAKRTDAEVDTLICEDEKRLNEILKVVHEDLDIKYFQKSAHQSAITKDDAENDNEKEQQAIKATATSKKDAKENATERVASATTVRNTDEKRDSGEFLEKIEEKSEVGIVGPPTAVSELINEEELRGDSALSADQKDHIVEWVENSVKVDTLSSVNAGEEENNIVKQRKQFKKKNAVNTRTKQTKMTNNALFMPIRKSQKIISSIIKRSIKW